MSKNPKSICSKCYAQKNMYTFPIVKAALERRFQSLSDPKWVEAMVTAIKHTKDDYFRWHDSGDLQSIDHLTKICEIANQLPNVQFWLPTKEIGMVKDFMKAGGKIPNNLCIRVSGYFMDKVMTVAGFPTANSTTDKSKVNCHAQQTDNKCGTCRKCWDKTQNIMHLVH